MTTEPNQFMTPLLCYENCKRVILPWKEALTKLWSSNYGWIAQSNYYMWNIQGYCGQNNVFEVANKVGMRFGFLMHTSEKQPVTIDDAETILNGGRELEVGTFISWASKFNRMFREEWTANELPRELWPFYYLEVPNGIYYISRPAYRMHPARTSFVIVGVDPAGKYNDSQVQWSLLLNKPVGNQCIKQAAGIPGNH